MRTWAAEDGAAIGAEAAESFRLIVLDEDDEEPAVAAEAAAE